MRRSYATVDYYRYEFKGAFGGGDGELERLLVTAGEDIDALTYYRIVEIGFERLTNEQAEDIMRACCYQADYIRELEKSGAGTVSRYDVNGVSVSLSKSKKYADRLGFDRRGLELLERTGLMWTGVR